jgi:hypothetical protein
MNLVFQIKEALVPHRDQRGEHFPHGHETFLDRNLAFLVLEVWRGLSCGH